MESQAELLFRSLESHGGLRDWHATIYILEGERIGNEYLKSFADVVEYERDTTYQRPWNVSPRWRCQPKSNTCICIDADVVFLDNFSLLAQECDDEAAVYGVKAWHSPFWNRHREQWKEVFDAAELPLPESVQQGVYMPYYINHGLIVVPAEYMPMIEQAVRNVSYQVYSAIPGLYYFAQLKTTVALESIGLPRKLLPGKFNSKHLQPDTVIWHYTDRRLEDVKAVLNERKTYDN